jgi:predicted translin family RNA/ssDNA-binding protein
MEEMRREIKELKDKIDEWKNIKGSEKVGNGKVEVKEPVLEQEREDIKDQLN